MSVFIHVDLENKDTTTCPYCGYEYECNENHYEDDEGELRIDNCPECKKKFFVTTKALYNFSTFTHNDFGETPDEEEKNE